MKAVDLADWDADATFDQVGTPLRRLDAHAKVTGRARYTTDVRLPGQLYAAVVRSPVPRGTVTEVDVSGALSLDGVVHVLTADELGDDVTWYEDDVPLLAGAVRFVGDEIAVVAAETIDAARAGAAAVRVSIETDPHAADFGEIEAGSAPAVLGDDNEVESTTTERGDVEAALAGAAHVLRATYRTQVAVHNALEPHACTALWDDEGVTLYCSTQGVNDVRESMADHLGLDHNQVRVVAEHVGGGFGAKQIPWKETMFAALLSKRTGRPVQVALDRRGENLAAGKRGRTEQTIAIGADDDGRLVAIDARLVDDAGAYQVPGESSALQGPSLYLYACDDVRVVRTTLRSNTGPSVAFRAPGYVEATFALESMLDDLARRLDIDPIELRRRNHVDHDQQTGVSWSQPDGILRSYDRIETCETWVGDDGTGDVDLPDGVVRGRGFAAHDWVAASAMPPGHAVVTFNFDGSVHVGTSAQDIGTGTRTMLTQVVAEELGVEPDRVRLSLGDTSTGPPAPTSAGSTTTPTMAPGVRAAARSAVEHLLDEAAEHLGGQRDSLSFDGTHVRVARGNDHPIADLLAEMSPVVIHGWGGRETTADEVGDVSPRAQGSAAAEVEVDTLTGQVTVRSITVSPDCGRILNPQLVDSQVIGGVTQGIGFALMEEQVLDERRGMVVNPDLNEYLVPTLTDTCVIHHAALDIADLAANPVGSKGIGELPLIAVPAAIANAVMDATGIRFTELPITRRRLLDALAERDRAEETS